MKKSALRASVARIGQISGSINGYWKTDEWFPIMVKSSQYLGCLPMEDRVRATSYSSVDVLRSRKETLTVDSLDLRAPCCIHNYRPHGLQRPCLPHRSQPPCPIHLHPPTSFQTPQCRTRLSNRMVPPTRVQHVTRPYQRREESQPCRPNAFFLPYVHDKIVSRCFQPSNRAVCRSGDRVGEPEAGKGETYG